jgi:glycerol-3-phosphate dehydrogenase
MLNDMLSYNRNAGVRPDRRLASARVLNAQDTRVKFPLVDRDGLMGGGLWHDAFMTSTARVLMETLRWGCGNGATALNYVECTGLLRERDAVAGIEAVDRTSGDSLELRADVVVNCAGPACRVVASRLDADHERLFSPSIAFNLLLDRPPLSEAALAVAPRSPGSRTYFLRPWRGRIFAGTFHAACDGYPASPLPTEAQIDRFVAELNSAVPALELTRESIVRIYSGLLPASHLGTDELAVREVIVDHASMGGPRGLWSVSGVKYTTARLVAERALGRIFSPRGRSLTVRPGTDRPAPATGLSPEDPSPLLRGPTDEVVAAVRALLDGEAVTCLEDLLLRRTDWGTDPSQARAAASALTQVLGHGLPARPPLHRAGVAADG